MRADARENRDRILDAARQAFAQNPDVSMRRRFLRTRIPIR